MTPDIITRIRERGSIEEDTMSAVAQHCLDNNPDITWRKVINALLDANEVTVARNVLDEHSGRRILCSCDNYFSFIFLGTSSSKNVCRTVKQVLRSHYSKLTASTQTCLSIIANELYSKNLINDVVMHSPTFEKIEIEFSAMVLLCTEDTKKMIEVCSNFLDCLSSAGGPAQEEAIALARDWENEVFKDHQVSFSLTKAATEFIPKEVQLSSNDRLAIELRTMHKKYAKLMTDITTYYASSGKHNAIVIARWVQNFFGETGLARIGVTVDEIFERIQPHHNFLDISIINDFIEAYPMDDSALQTRLHKYTVDIKAFIDSANLSDIIKTIKVFISKSTKVDPKIILKLSGEWRKQTIGHVHKLLEYIFKKEAKCIIIDDFSGGSICIQFSIFSKRSIQLLIVKSRVKYAYLHLLGIFQLTIDNQTIIDREEDIGFTFEESLLHSIASIESSPEYHRLSLLLIELKIELNYKNTNGQTPLMLASVGGHIEIFNSLLQNGANLFVQLPSNKGYIGLNHLACTALSQHIYQSIGGERIIPQDDTSVEDMLEMAVKEREVSSHFYEPFMHVIENNLKEKFQQLQDCFHALNSNFLKAVTNILTSKALVTEAKQKFQSYIKEDVNCENAHQLVQLLQPHYSCLNINLLTIPCTITEPIKEQVEEYNTNLKMFKDTTSLLEFAMMTKGMQYPDGVSCSKLILRLNKSWCSRTIAELNKMGNFYLLPTLSSLNLIKTHYDASSCTCTYFLPQLSQTESLIAAVFEQRVSLYAIGVFEVMIDDIPIMMEDEDCSFTFEAALQEAHRTNNENVLFFLLELNITLPIENDDTDLMIASEKGDYLTVQFLLNKDPDINIQDNNGWTALMYASRYGHHQVAALLLSKDPYINIQSNDGWTALILASRYGHHQVVELLLSKDPGIDIQDNDGWTALMVASDNGHHQVVELLLSKDPDINSQNNYGVIALMSASFNGHHQVVELLLSKDPDINIQNNDGETALMFASGNGHHQVVEFLLSNNPDINIQNNDGLTALMPASCNGHHQVVELLLSKDPGIDIQDNDGWTALMYASRCGHHQVVELLLSKDPDINIQNNDGWTALMYASRCGHHQIVELLLNKDPDIDIQNNDGLTTLMFASGNGHHQVVELLLSKNPNINIQNNDGLTALMSASATGHHQIVELLLSKDPDINIQNNNDGFTALMLGIGFGHHQVVELLLSKDSDINIQSNNGGTALMFASANGHHQVVELLLSKDPDINIQNNDGVTALMSASGNGHHQVVELLLSKDPDINIQDCNGFSAFTLTLYFHNKMLNDQHTQMQLSNYIKILKLLLEPHLNHIHTINNVEIHSLSLAALFNDFDAVTILMEKCDITPEHIISAFTWACNGGHSSMIIHLSEKITTFSDNEKLLVAAAKGDLGTLISMISEVGMSPDTPLVAGTTPLMIAASCGHIELVDILIQAGADVNKRNDEGMNALDIVSDTEFDFYDRSDIKELLITNTPAGEPDPVSNNDETTNMKPTPVAVIKSILGMSNSFMKEAYNPYYSKQEELKIPYGVTDTSTPNSAMTSNMSQFLS